MKRIIAVAIVQVVLAITTAVAGIGAKNGELGFDFGYAGFDADFPGGNGGRLAVRGGYISLPCFRSKASTVLRMILKRARGAAHPRTSS